MWVVDNARKITCNRAGIYQILSRGDNFEIKLRFGQPNEKWFKGKADRFPN